MSSIRAGINRNCNADMGRYIVIYLPYELINGYIYTPIKYVYYYLRTLIQTIRNYVFKFSFDLKYFSVNEGVSGRSFTLQVINCL